MEIKRVDFEKYKSDEMNVSFNDLDVNGDDVLDKKDKDLAKNPEVFNMLTHLLGSNDEEAELTLIDDFDFLEKSGSDKTSNLSSKSTLTAQTSDCPDGNCGETLSADECPNGNCSFAVTSEISSNEVKNSDGTYTETTTNTNGATVAITYDANNKKVSSKTTNKDGSVVTSSYKYNSDGSYSVTTKYADKTRVTKYNSAGKKISYTDKFNNGTTKTATFKYNSDGSYSVIVKNKKTGSVSTVKYNSSGKKISSVSKNRKGKTTKKITYKYNSDGSYKEITQNYNSTTYKTSNTKIQTYDKNGKKIKTSAASNTVTTANASNYKDSLNQNGVSYVVFTRFDGTCSHCNVFAKQLENISSALDGVANFIKMDISGDDKGSNAANYNLGLEFVKKYNKTALPLIIKFVNGKPAGCSNSIYKFTGGSAYAYDQILKDVKNSTQKSSAATTSSTTTNSSSNTTDAASKKKTAPTTVTGKNYKNKITKKGVTYLILGNTNSCGGCIRLDKQLKKLMKNGKLQSSTILSMNISDDASSNVLRDYVTQFNMWQTRKDGSKYVSFPLILKFVDGVAVGFVSDIKDVSDAQIISKLS